MLIGSDAISIQLPEETRLSRNLGLRTILESDSLPKVGERSRLERLGGIQYILEFDMHDKSRLYRRRRLPWRIEERQSSQLDVRLQTNRFDRDFHLQVCSCLGVFSLHTGQRDHLFQNW